MAALRLVRKWGVPLATAASMPILGPVVFADSGKKENSEPTSRMIRPSDLPIYEEPEEVLDFEYYDKERTSLEEGVGVVRKEIEGMLEVTRSARERVGNIYETGKAHSMATVDMVRDLQYSRHLSTMDYITDEENILPRAGAITIGGLAGLIIGARKKGGFVKRVLYTSTGVVTAASLCYPRQAYHISQQAYENAKDYANIGYNFVAGVKPQSKVSTPVEPKKEASSTVAENAAPLPKVEVPLAPETPSPTTEPEGAEVRSVIPQILHPEKSPAPIDSVAQQASDVTQWGFRLTDETSTTSSSLADVVSPAEPTVPEGFGSVGEINRDSAEATAEQKVIKDEAEIVNLIKEASFPEVAEPAQAKGIPEITVEVVKDSAQKDVDVEEKVAGVVEQKVSVKTVDVVEEVSHISVEKVADIVEEKVAEVVAEAAQKVEQDATEVAEAAEVIEEVGSKIESALGVVENIAEAAAEALHGTSDVPESVMEKVEQMKQATEEAESIVDTITVVAEKVEEVTEDIKREAGVIETEATEVMQSMKEKEDLDEVPLGTDEKIVKPETEIESSQQSVTELKESTPELVSKLEEEPMVKLDFVEKEAKETSAGEPLVPVEKQGLFDKLFNFFSEEKRTVTIIEPVEEFGGDKAKEPPVISGVPSESGALSAEKILEEGVEVAEAKVEDAESQEIPLPDLATLAKDEEIPDTIGEVLEPVMEGVGKDVIEDVVESAVETVAVVVKEAAEDIVKVASDVVKVTDVVEEVGDKVVSVLDAIQEVTEEVQETPGVSEAVAFKAVVVKQVSEVVEKVVEGVTHVAEKVEDVADVIKTEAKALETQATELIHSEEKRKELMESVTEFIGGSESSSSDVEKDTSLALPEEEFKELGIETTPKVLTEPVPEASMQEEKPEEKLAEVSAVEPLVPDEDRVPTPVVKEGLFDKLAHLLSKGKDKDEPAAGVDSVVELVSKPTLEELKELSIEPVRDITEEIVTDTSIDTKEKEDLTDKREGVPVDVAVPIPEELKEPSVEPTTQETKETVFDKIEDLIVSTKELKEPSVETAPEVLPESASEASTQLKELEEKSSDVHFIDSVIPAEDSVPKLDVREGLFDKLSHLFSKSKEMKDEPAASVDSVVEPASKPTSEELKEPSVEPTVQETKELILSKTEEVVKGSSIDTKEKEGLADTREEVSVEEAALTPEEPKEPSVESVTQETKEPVVDRIEELKEPSVDIAPEVLPEPAPAASTKEKRIEEIDVPTVESVVLTEDGVPKPVVKEGLFNKLASLFSKDEETKEVQAVAVGSVVEPVSEPTVEMKEPSVGPAIQEAQEPVLDKTEEIVAGISTDAEEQEGLIGKKEVLVEGAVSTQELKEPPGEPTIQEGKESLLERIKELVLPKEELKESSVETASEVLPEPVPEVSAQEKEPEEKSADIAAVESVTPTEDSVPKPVVKEGLFDKLASLFSKDEEKKDLPVVGVDSVVEPVTELTEKLEEPSAEPTTQEEKEPVLDKTEELVTGASTDVEQKEGLIGKKEEDCIEVVVSTPEELKEPSGEPTIKEEKEPVLDRIEEPLLPTEELKEPSVETVSGVLPEPVPEPSALEKAPEEKYADIVAVESVTPTEDSVPKPVVKEGLFDKLASLFSKDEDKKDLTAVDVDSVVEPITEPTEKLKEESAEPITQEAKENVLDKTEELVTDTSTDAEEKEAHIEKKEEVPVEEVVSTPEELKEPSGEPTIQEGKEPVLGRIEEPLLSTEKLKEPSVETVSGVLPEPVPEPSAPEEKSANIAGVVTPTEDSVPKPVVKEGLFDKLASLFSKGEDKKDLPAVGVDLVVEPITEPTEKLKEESAEPTTQEAKETVLDKTEELVTDTSTDAEEKEGHIGKTEEVPVKVVVSTPEELKEPSIEPSVQEGKELVLDRIEELVLPAEELKESSVETASGVLPEPEQEVSALEKEPDEKSAVIAAVESEAQAEDSVPKSVVKEGLFDKIASFFSKDEEKKDLPAFDRDTVVEPVSELTENFKEPSAEPTTQEAKESVLNKTDELVIGTSIAAEKEGHIDTEVKEQITKEVKSSDIEILTSAVELKESEKSSDQIPVELHTPVVDTPVTPVKTEGFFNKLSGFFKDEEKEDAPVGDSVVEPIPEPTAEELKETRAQEAKEHLPEKMEETVIGTTDITEEKESVIDRLASLFSKDEEKKVPDEGAVPPADSVVESKEPVSDLPDKEVKEGLLDKLAVLFSKEKEDDSLAESMNFPVVEETKEVEELSATAREATEPTITTPDEIVKDGMIESADQPEAVVSEKKSLFGKIAGVFSGSQSELVSDSGTVVSDSSAVIDTEPAETIGVLPDAAPSVEELPKLDTKAEKLVPETDTQEKEPKEKSVDSPAVEVTEAAVVVLSPPIEKEGLFDKLASFLSKDEDKKDVPATDAVPAADLKETDENSADKVSVELKKPDVDATLTTGDDEGLFGKLTGFLFKDEEKKEVPAAAIAPASELSELEGKSTNSGIAEVIEPTIDTASLSAGKEGLFGKVTSLFSKHEEKIEDQVEGSVPGAVSAIKELTETSSDLSEQELMEQSVELKTTVNTPTTTKEREGLFDKLAGLFSKENTNSPVTIVEESVVEKPEDLPTDPGETSEQLSSKPEVSSGDSSAVKVDDRETSVVQDKKSIIDRITTIFGDKKEPVSSPVGDAPEDDNVIKSSAEIENVTSESTPAIVNTQEPLLQVEDKSLFDRLAELVSGDEKKAVPATDEVSAQSETETLPGTSETVNQEISEKSETDSLEIVTEPKSSIFDRVTNFFSNKEDSKEVEKDVVSPQLVEEVPAEVIEQSENNTVTGDNDDTYVVNTNPSSPDDVRAAEESGEQSGDASASAWRGWFRTGASVKQEGKDVIVQLTPPKPVETDYGQSNPEDSDMYTTRS